MLQLEKMITIYINLYFLGIKFNIIADTESSGDNGNRERARRPLLEAEVEILFEIDY